MKVGKRPARHAKRPIEQLVLVSIPIGSFMGCFDLMWWNMAPLKHIVERSMKTVSHEIVYGRLSSLSLADVCFC